MILTETKGDLFNVPQGYYLAHCISGDYALGAGIAKRFDQEYNMKHKLNKYYHNPNGLTDSNIGKAMLVDNVFNLVTKNRYFNKPTYMSLSDALYDMKMQMIDRDIKKIAMPLIGCGLDRLEWDKVKEIITQLFADTDIEIRVCRL